MDTLGDWFGEATLAAREARIRAFWNGGERFLVTLTSSRAGYRQTYDDAAMLRLAPDNLRHQATLAGVNLPTFFPDFGTVSTARYWGGRTRFDSTGSRIFIDPAAADVQAALALTPLPPDHPEMDAARGLRLWRQLCESLPTRQLWFRMPDFQGPLNTAAQIVAQEEFLMAMHEEPEAVHALLARVTEHLVGYTRHCHEVTGGKTCGFIWPYTIFPADLGVALTEDLMPLLAADSYAEFGVPCLRRFAAAFGGLHLHCCGVWGHHVPALVASGLPIRAVEFHHPYTKVEELAPLADRAVLIPMLALDKQHDFPDHLAFYRHLLERTPASWRYWFALGDDPDSQRFARDLGF